MRVVYLHGCESITEALERCPWAAEVIETEDGWVCFESVVDAQRWTDQQ